MKNLKITTRLAISIVFLIAALLFLVHAYFNTKQHDVQTLRQERDAIVFLTQMTATTEALSRYRISLFRILSGEEGFEDTIEDERLEVNQEFEKLKSLYLQYEKTFKFMPDLLEQRMRQIIKYEHIFDLWEKVSVADYHNVPLADYDHIFECLMMLSAHVAETSGLVADEDIATHALADTITLHVTEVMMRTLGAESRGYVSVVKGVPVDKESQLTSWDYGTFVMRDNLRLVENGIKSSRYYSFEETPHLHSLENNLQQALARYLKHGKQYAQVRIDMGEGKVVDHERYVTSGLSFTRAMFDLWYAGALKLDHMIERREEHARAAATTAIALTLLAVTIGFLFFVYVSRGIVASLKDIERAMDKVAHGDLDLEVPHLDNRDEIGSMARSLERFRTSYWWLKD